jgi:small-conductance mechanosensitive channel
MIIIKAIGWFIAVILVITLWAASISLTKPVYNPQKHMWEEDREARFMSNVAIALIIITVFTVGYLCA